ncbi:MAG TPA: FG-GAP-like repeat-containing protein [Rhizomicrobium sp.]|nr:FG-GAP-like repeat-containing protein [Rhizomicrobium sp.]
MLAAADFNGDGHQDLAVAELGPSDAGLLLGNGDGTFQADQENPAGLPAASIAAGDLNGDGNPDLVVGSYLPGGTPAQFSTLINSAAPTTSTLSDPTFAAATGGNVDIPFNSEQVLQEPSGKILTVGHQGSVAGDTSQGVIEQLNADGTADNTFGAASLVTTPMSSNDAFYSAALQPNGQIIAVGSSGADFLVARYNADGSLDTTFGSSGFATADFGADGAAVASSVAIEPDGSIVVGGQAGSVFALARFTAAGALDSQFNPAGADDATFPAGGERTISTGSAGSISQILIEGDGSILGVGSAGTTSAGGSFFLSIAVLRLNADGSNDPTFGTGGILTIAQLHSQDSTGAAITPAIGLQPGGSILVAGEAGTQLGFAAVRLSSSGTLDENFGGPFQNDRANAVAGTSFGGANDDVNSIQVNPTDGEFVLTGTTNAGGIPQIAVAAFNPDGTPNTAAFPPNGQTTMSVPSLLGESLVKAPGTGGSKIVESVRPFAFHPQNTDFSFATFQNDGKLLVGASGASDSTLRRIQPFTATVTPIGAFGKIGRKNVKLPAFTLADETSVTIILTGGSGTASHVGNQVQLTLSGSVNVTIRTKGGSNSLSLSGVSETGNLRSFNAPTATLAGTLSTSGTIGQLTLAAISGVVISAGGISNLKAGNISGSVSCAGVLAIAKVTVLSGTIAAAQIRNLTAGNLSHATILAGANLGSDGQLGGAGAAADTYGAGLIQSLHVTGTIVDSFIGAGVDPVDGIFGNGNDVLVGTKSLVRALSVKLSVDSLTRFEAGGFPKIVHIRGKVITASDPRFVVL